jgi:ubiquinone/menaquinone biosynthesis C-methylase UbiE
MTKADVTTGWTSVDQTTDPRSFMRVLETACSLDAVQTYKRHTFELLAPHEGAQFLDVGCGLGDDVLALARLVGSQGRVVGIDGSEAMIAEARKRTAGTSFPVEYRVGDVYRLDFADHTFEGCRADRLFAHLDHPQQALAEMIRVTKPGGRLVVHDPDLETRVIDAPNRAVTRKILNFFCDHVRNGWSGRQLWRLFREAELEEVAIHTHTLVLTDYAVAEQLFRLRQTAESAQQGGVVSAAEVTAWLDYLEEAHQRGSFFLASTQFYVSGRKP